MEQSQQKNSVLEQPNNGFEIPNSSSAICSNSLNLCSVVKESSVQVTTYSSCSGQQLDLPMNGRIITVSAGDAHYTTSSIISFPSLLESGYQEPLDILKYANGKPLGADDPLIDDVEPIY